MVPPAMLPVLVLSFASAAAAQTSPATLTAEKVPGTVKNAGIYHVSTGTWTRTGGVTANFGPDVIYSNTALSSYFSSAGGAGGFAPLSTNFDEGNVPGSTNPNNPGNRNEYSVNCVAIAYCDMDPGATAGWDLSFYDSYSPCTFNATPDTTIQVTSLPSGGCWFVTLDLTGGGEFCLLADGDGSYAGATALDSFGWSYRYAGTGGTMGAGFLLAADPMATDPNYMAGGLPVDGTNTYFGPPSLCGPGIATGLLTQDFWWLEDPSGLSSNCYWFGGYSNNNGCGGPSSTSFASWFMELTASVGPCNRNFGSIYCNSNPNSTGVNSTIDMFGSSIALDDNVRMTATLPTNSFGFFITSVTPGFAANPGGSMGNICLAGSVGRFVGPGQIMSSGPGGTITLSTIAGQWSLTAIPTATGPYGAVAGMTSNFQAWHRDLVMGQSTSNFTDGISVLWL